MRASSMKQSRTCGLSGRLLVLVLVFNLMNDLPRQARPDEAVNQIRRENHRQRDRQDIFASDEQEGGGQNDGDHLWEGAFGAPIEGLEGGILHFTDHHEREKDHDDRHDVTPRRLCESLVQPATVIQPEQEQGDGGYRAGGGGNRETKKIPASTAACGCQTVETRQSKRAANQINRRDEPADFRVFFKDIVQHDAVHQKRRRGAKGNNVGQRVEFASERAVLSSEARHPPVQEVKNTGEDDKKNGVADGGTEGAGIGDVRSDDERQRQKAAKKISRRQQIREQINFQLRSLAFGSR